jgi:hypothetical protein
LCASVVAAAIIFFLFLFFLVISIVVFASIEINLLLKLNDGLVQVLSEYPEELFVEVGITRGHGRLKVVFIVDRSRHASLL